MKRFLIIAMTAITLITTLVGCETEYTTYSGSEYVMFADSLSVLAIQNNDDIFDITIGSTTTCNYDRTMAVEILDQRSNAIEGFHYSILSNTVTIKAGENTTNVKVKGNYDNLQINDSIGFTMSLIADKTSEWDIYPNSRETKVLLQKIKPFDINAFTGYAVVTSTFLYEYSTSMNRLIETTIDTTEDCTIVMHDFIYDGYDVKIKFDTTDVLNPLIMMEDQVMVSTGEAFGTIYGDGYLNMYLAPQYTSYYSTNENFMFQYYVVYVPGMAEGTNVVGLFANTIKWISDDEAEEIKRTGF
ncbi:MAG: DUF4984 domain-containing protein [Marinifilaceae bacterium]|nr:DUF4984 domain-containing protein [Marinifilaceae bacterium]